MTPGAAPTTPWPDPGSAAARPPAVSREQCLAAAQESFAAAASDGVVERRFRIADETVAIRFADARLADDLGSAFAHHAGSREPAGLTILAWESRRSGAAVPPVAPDAVDGGVSAGARLAGAQDVEWRYDPPRRILNVLDRRRDVGLFHVPDRLDLPHWEQSSPFRQLLAWWFRARGKQLVHAAAIGSPAAGVLLAGRGGSGKSSSTLACLERPRAGLGVASDDYCVVDPIAHTAWTLYCTAKVGWEQLRFFPHLERFVVNAGSDDEKALFRFGGPEAPALAPQVAIDATIAPQVDADGVSACEPLSRAAALRALAPSSMFQLAGPNADDFREMADLVASRPAFRLRLGGDPLVVPALLGDTLDRLGSTGRAG